MSQQTAKPQMLDELLSHSREFQISVAQQLANQQFFIMLRVMLLFATAVAFIPRTSSVRSSMIDTVVWFWTIYAVAEFINILHAFIVSRSAFTVQTTQTHIVIGPKTPSKRLLTGPFVRSIPYDAIGTLVRGRLGVWKLALWSGHRFLLPATVLTDADIAIIRREMHNHAERARERRVQASKR